MIDCACGLVLFLLILVLLLLLLLLLGSQDTQPLAISPSPPRRCSLNSPVSLLCPRKMGPWRFPQSQNKTMSMPIFKANEKKEKNHRPTSKFLFFCTPQPESVKIFSFFVADRWSRSLYMEILQKVKLAWRTENFRRLTINKFHKSVTHGPPTQPPTFRSTSFTSEGTSLIGARASSHGSTTLCT